MSYRQRDTESETGRCRETLGRQLGRDSRVGETEREETGRGRELGQ